MEVKKKTFLDNFRQLKKLGNPKKQRKTEEIKLGRRFGHRRSISVPNLTLVPGGAFSLANSPDAMDFGFGPGVSDTDSVTSATDVGPNTDTDGPSDSLSETGILVPACRRDLRDGPVDSEEKVNPPLEALYAQVQKRGKEEVPRFTFDSIPTLRSAFPTTPFFSEFEERGRLYSEPTPAGRVLRHSSSSALIRGEQVNEPKRSPLSDKGTPPAMKRAPADRMFLTLDSVGTPLESADGTSLDSACGTPSEERLNLPWTTDSEDLDRDLSCPLFMKDLSAEEALLEQFQAEEAAEDTEVSSAQVDLRNANKTTGWLVMVTQD